MIVNWSQKVGLKLDFLVQANWIRERMHQYDDTLDVVEMILSSRDKIIKSS